VVTQGTLPPSVQRRKRRCKNNGGMHNFNNSHELLGEIRTTMHKEIFPLKGNIFSGTRALGERVSIQEIGCTKALVIWITPMPLFKITLNVTGVRIMGTKQLHVNVASFSFS